ncbi:hypothetical protein ACFFUP_01950 [Vibrio ostreicida]|uniref:Uncharacterized protein n=1 Tax=Vibrio ostreicida TaxID=526588 RepID=A0ABT8BWI4_9VIBR|nr:hypothetical protein [Vibrio ostreicida]MDN3610450.1 hypothetical protein [Vibrio ostreicida]NPD07546.1 hypothetical protein [Vibrio ostreicida]
MSVLIRCVFLAIPLFFLGLAWLGVILGIDLIPDGFLRDDTFEYSGDGKKPTGLVSQSWFNSISLVAMVPGFFVGFIYTVYKKLWRWFWAYMIIGGLPVGIFSIAVYLG